MSCGRMDYLYLIMFTLASKKNVCFPFKTQTPRRA